MKTLMMSFLMKLKEPKRSETSYSVIVTTLFLFLGSFPIIGTKITLLNATDAVLRSKLSLIVSVIYKGEAVVLGQVMPIAMQLILFILNLVFTKECNKLKEFCLDRSEI